MAYLGTYFPLQFSPTSSVQVGQVFHSSRDPPLSLKGLEKLA